MSNKSVLLSAGDSFATFNTYDCGNLEIIHNDCHAVQIIADKYNVDAYDAGIPGGGIQDSVVNALYHVNNMPNISLIFFHITQTSRFPVDDQLLLDVKLDRLENFHSFEELEPPKHIDNIISRDKDYTDYISKVPVFKFQLDDIAYLLLLMQVCKQKNIGIIFVSEFVACSTAWKDLSLFKSEPNVRVCDSFLCHKSNLDQSMHHYNQIKGNHLCQHYQEYLANEYLERYSEFIRDSLL